MARQIPSRATRYRRDPDVELARDVAFTFTLDPTVELDGLFRQCAGARRWLWNSALAEIRSSWTARRFEQQILGGKLTERPPTFRDELINYATATKNESEWARELPAKIFECAAVDLANALERGFKGAARSPKFRSKRKDRARFRLRGDSFGIDESKVWLPGVDTPVRVHGSTRKLRRLLRTGRFRPQSYTISLRGGRWQLSVAGTAATFHPNRTSSRRRGAPRTAEPVGVDRGLRNLVVAATADGDLVAKVPALRSYRNSLRQLRHAQRALARTKRGSKGQEKARARVARIHTRARDQRADALHKLSTRLVESCEVLVLEDLNIAGMAKDRHIAMSVADAAMSELARQITYKADWGTCEVVQVDRWFPSSKTCTGCGHHHADLPRGAATFDCPACGGSIDRDLNAATNLAREGQRIRTDHPPPQLVVA